MPSLKPSLTVIKGTPPSDNSVQVPLSVEALYQQYQSSLLNYLIGLVPGGRQDATEILQETYIRLLRMDDIQRLQDNPKAYLFTVATNLVRDNLRKRQSRHTDAHIPFDEMDHHSDEDTPIRAANWEESVAMMKSALLNLKPVTRQVFLLSRFEEMTYPEIAEALNISTRTVERHMSKAITELQKALGGLL